MIIAVTATTDKAQGAVDERFGRARGFFLFDTSKGEYRFLDNSVNVDQAEGVGVKAVQTLMKESVEVILTCNIGPRAHVTLAQGGIRAYEASGMSVEEAISAFLDDQLKQLTAPNVTSHSGQTK